MQEILALLERRNKPLVPRLPFPIFNATASIADNLYHHGAAWPATIYEFSPVRYGSDGLGFGGTPPHDLPLARIVSISGAAYDGKQVVPGEIRRTLLSAINIDLGQYIDNPDPEFAHMKWGAFPVFGPLFHARWLLDRKGYRIYVSDGGHADNLGVFSLVRRGCGEIIAVDAEHDPNFGFDGYFRLKSAIARHMGAETDIPELRAIEVISAGLANKTRKGNGTAFVDTVYVPIVKGKAGGKKFSEGGKVLNGCIGEFPGLGNGGASLRIPLRYVKLSIEPEWWDADSSGSTRQRLAQRHGMAVSDRFMNRKTKECAEGRFFDSDCPFPQEATSDQDFDTEQYRAYRDLGFSIAMKLPEARQTNTCNPS
ncbi:MAG: hypothetical protein FJX46_12570 [Alphaproteobacteria bacterium]|nr:hypothetical protein [Alphaproteobacteria bacterium]